MEYHLTKHAIKRMAQRGVKRSTLRSIIEHADIELPARQSCILLRISRQKANALNIVDQLASYAAILSEDNYVVTVLPIRRTKSGNRYRRYRS